MGLWRKMVTDLFRIDVSNRLRAERLLIFFKIFFQKPIDKFTGMCYIIITERKGKQHNRVQGSGKLSAVGFWRKTESLPSGTKGD